VTDAAPDQWTFSSGRLGQVNRPFIDIGRDHVPSPDARPGGAMPHPSPDQEYEDGEGQ
jgi:hypothetical protein